jgi:hypothetical protein
VAIAQTAENGAEAKPTARQTTWRYCASVCARARLRNLCYSHAVTRTIQRGWACWPVVSRNRMVIGFSISSTTCPAGRERPQLDLFAESRGAEARTTPPRASMPTDKFGKTSLLRAVPAAQAPHARQRADRASQRLSKNAPTQRLHTAPRSLSRRAKIFTRLTRQRLPKHADRKQGARAQKVARIAILT